MYKQTKAQTLQAQTIIDSVAAVAMYAQKSDNGNMTMNITIQSEKLYEENKEECDADIAHFREEADKL